MLEQRWCTDTTPSVKKISHALDTVTESQYHSSLVNMTPVTQYMQKKAHGQFLMRNVGRLANATTKQPNAQTNVLITIHLPILEYV